MAISAHSYGTPIKNWMTGANTIDFDTDTFKVGLVTATYTPNVDTDAFWTVPVANELASGSGYTTGGVALGSPSVELVGASNLVDWKGANPTWTFTAAVEFRYAVVYKSTGTSSTSPLIFYVDAGETLKVNGAWTLEWAAAGLLSAEYG